MTFIPQFSNGCMMFTLKQKRFLNPFRKIPENSLVLCKYKWNSITNVNLLIRYIERDKHRICIRILWGDQEYHHVNNEWDNLLPLNEETWEFAKDIEILGVIE